MLTSQFVVHLYRDTELAPATFRSADETDTAQPHNLGKIALGLHSVGGAVHLVDDLGSEGWANVHGLGVRASYTARSWLSVAGSVEALRSGDASFDPVGARISGSRLQAYALAHFGRRVVPYVRIGVGVFAGSLNVDGRGNQFRLGGVWGLGVGTDIWLTDRMVAGAVASYLDGELLSAEFGLHLGYAWEL